MAKTNEELLEKTRENAVEMALRERLQRQFGSYTIDGAEGIIGRREGGVFINYRELAQIAIAHSDLFEGRPLVGVPEHQG